MVAFLKVIFETLNLSDFYCNGIWAVPTVLREIFLPPNPGINPQATTCGPAYGTGLSKNISHSGVIHHFKIRIQKYTLDRKFHLEIITSGMVHIGAPGFNLGNMNFLIY
jgi:hypothetical protein